MKIDIEKIRDQVQRSTGERVSIQVVSGILSAACVEEMLSRLAELEYLDSEARQGAELAQDEIEYLRAENARLRAQSQQGVES